MDIKPLLAAAVATALIGSALAQSQTPPDRPMGGMERRDGMGPGRMNPERMFEGLDLADAQRAQLRALADDHRRTVEPLRERMRAAQQTIADAKPGDADYDARTAAARKELDQARGMMRDAHEEFRKRSDAVLTPEQRNEMERRRGEMRERMEERGGTGEGRGGRERGGDRHGGHRRTSP